MLKRPIKQQAKANHYDPVWKLKRKKHRRTVLIVSGVIVLALIFKPTRAFIFASIFDNPAISSLAGVIILILGGIEVNTRHPWR